MLAIILAASFLQLHDTPWISERWSERDVLFCEETPRTNAIQCKPVDVRHPSVRKNYDTNVNSAVQDAVLYEATIIPPAASRPNYADGLNLLALAKMLLQIR